MTQQTNWAALIFGGIFIGAWIYGMLFGFGDVNGRPFEPVPWGFWGVLGLAIAGGLYAARVTSEVTRIIIIVLVGVFIGILVLAAVLEEDAYIVATFVTGAGAGLVAAALPRPDEEWEQVE